MTAEHSLTLTCDICKAQSHTSYGWACIDISGTANVVTLLPDREYDLCPDCWKSHILPLIYHRKPQA